MQHHWVLLDGHEKLELRLASSLAPAPSAAQRVSRDQAPRLAERAIRRAIDGERIAIAMYQAMSSAAGPPFDVEVASQSVFRALRTGRLELWLKRLEITESREPADPVILAQQTIRQRIDLTWVEIELVDEAGAPVPGQRYEIELPDGSPPRRGRLDDKGLAYVANVPAGQCSVTFPDYDERVWELVATSATPRSRDKV